MSVAPPSELPTLLPGIAKRLPGPVEMTLEYRFEYRKLRKCYRWDVAKTRVDAAERFPALFIEAGCRKPVYQSLGCPEEFSANPDTPVCWSQYSNGKSPEWRSLRGCMEQTHKISFAFSASGSDVLIEVWMYNVTGNKISAYTMLVSVVGKVAVTKASIFLE
jgi:hypothetical protein